MPCYNSCKNISLTVINSIKDIIEFIPESAISKEALKNLKISCDKFAVNKILDMKIFGGSFNEMYQEQYDQIFAGKKSEEIIFILLDIILSEFYKTVSVHRNISEDDPDKSKRKFDHDLYTICENNNPENCFKIEVKTIKSHNIWISWNDKKIIQNLSNTCKNIDLIFICKQNKNGDTYPMAILYAPTFNDYLKHSKEGNGVYYNHNQAIENEHCWIINKKLMDKNEISKIFGPYENKNKQL